MEVKTLRLKFWSDFIGSVRLGLSTPTRSSSVLLETHLFFYVLFTHLLFGFCATNWICIAYVSRRKSSLDPGLSCGPEATEFLERRTVAELSKLYFHWFQKQSSLSKSKTSGGEEAKLWIIKRAITEKTCFKVLQACLGALSYYITHIGVCFVFCKHVNHLCLLTSRRSLVSLTWICFTWCVINWVMCDSYWPHAAVCLKPLWSKHVLIIAPLIIQPLRQRLF